MSVRLISVVVGFLCNIVLLLNEDTRKQKLTVGFICTLITYSTPTINPREGVVFSRLWPSVFRHIVGIHTFEWVVCWMSYTLSMKPKSNGFTTTDCSSSQYIIYWAPGKAVRRTHKVALVMSHWRSLYRVAQKACNDFDHYFQGHHQ